MIMPLRYDECLGGSGVGGAVTSSDLPLPSLGSLTPPWHRDCDNDDGGSGVVSDATCSNGNSEFDHTYGVTNFIYPNNGSSADKLGGEVMVRVNGNNIVDDAGANSDDKNKKNIYVFTASSSTSSSSQLEDVWDLARSLPTPPRTPPLHSDAATTSFSSSSMLPALVGGDDVPNDDFLAFLDEKFEPPQKSSSPEEELYSEMLKAESTSANNDVNTDDNELGFELVEQLISSTGHGRSLKSKLISDCMWGGAAAGLEMPLPTLSSNFISSFHLLGDDNVIDDREKLDDNDEDDDDCLGFSHQHSADQHHSGDTTNTADQQQGYKPSDCVNPRDIFPWCDDDDDDGYVGAVARPPPNRTIRYKVVDWRPTTTVMNRQHQQRHHNTSQLGGRGNAMLRTKRLQDMYSREYPMTPHHQLNTTTTSLNTGQKLTSLINRPPRRSPTKSTPSSSVISSGHRVATAATPSTTSTLALRVPRSCRAQVINDKLHLQLPRPGGPAGKYITFTIPTTRSPTNGGKLAVETHYITSLNAWFQNMYGKPTQQPKKGPHAAAKPAGARLSTSSYSTTRNRATGIGAPAAMRRAHYLATNPTYIAPSVNHVLPSVPPHYHQYPTTSTLPPSPPNSLDMDDYDEDSLSSGSLSDSSDLSPVGSPQPAGGDSWHLGGPPRRYHHRRPTKSTSDEPPKKKRKRVNSYEQNPVHKRSEQQRRVDLRNLFTDLKRSVPNLESSSASSSSGPGSGVSRGVSGGSTAPGGAVNRSSKATRLSILKGAVEHVALLKQKEKWMREEKVALKARQEALLNKLWGLRNGQAPAFLYNM